MAGKGVHAHQRIEVADVDHVISSLASLQLLERHLSEVVFGLTLKSFIELALDVKNVHIESFTNAKVATTQDVVWLSRVPFINDDLNVGERTFFVVIKLELRIVAFFDDSNRVNLAAVVLSDESCLDLNLT